MGECINLRDKILVFELIFGIPLDTIVEAFRNWEEVEILHESADRFLVISPDWLPSFERRVIEFHFVCKRAVGVNGADMWDHGGES